jgi:hypothetical protein
MIQNDSYLENPLNKESGLVMPAKVLPNKITADYIRETNLKLFSCAWNVGNLKALQNK